MKKTFDLEFCFKGKRNYVQGPDIFDSVYSKLLHTFSKIQNIKYTAYDMLRTNATLYITDSFIKSDYANINSLITFKNDNIKYYAIVCQNQNLIECSTPYSEQVVENNSIIEDNLITFKNVLPDSYTEIVVSMNKYFLNQTSESKGKWIVTKFDYSNPSEIANVENVKIKIELIQNFNDKLTKSLLYINDKQVGYLYFTLINKDS